MAGPEAQLRRRIEHGLEKWQPADVIQMCVAEQDIRIYRPFAFGQSLAELSQSRASIEDDEMRPATKLNANGVAAIARRRGTRRGQAAPHTPEPEPHISVVHQWVSRQT